MYKTMEWSISPYNSALAREYCCQPDVMCSFVVTTLKIQNAMYVSPNM